MKVLVPLDLVQPTDLTVSALKVFLNLKNADVKLLYVREMWPAYENVMKTVGSFPDDWEKQLDAKAHDVFNQVLSKLQPLCKSVTTEITTGPPAMMINTVARDEKFDVIVLTPGKHSPAELLFSGSVSGRVIDNAEATTLVVRSSGKAAQLEKAMIGFDGSSYARRALDTALQYFNLAASQCKVTVVYSVDIVDPIKYLGPVAFVSDLEQNLLMKGEAFLAEAKKLLADRGVKNVDCCLVEGDPAAELIKMANDYADLVIMGAKGHSTVTSFHLGSVSHKVANNASSSVAVVKPIDETGK